MTDSRSRIRFGAFEFDTETLELSKRGIKIKISGQAMQILALLLYQRGEVVTRESLREQLWAKDTYVDFEHSLNSAVNKLREVLNDDSARPRFIETVPRRGYRFIEDVIPVDPVPPEPILPSQPLPSAERANRPRRIALIAILATSLSLVASVLAYRSLRPDPDWRVAIEREAQITTSPNLALYPSFSPDATRLAYSIDRGNGYEIVVRQVENDERELALTNDGQQNIQAVWSPDGNTIAYHSRKRGGIWAVPALGGSARLITKFGSHPSWSPDGNWVAFQSGSVNDLGADGPGVYAPSSIWIVRPDGTGARQLTKPGDPEGGHGAPSWSPDRRHIVFMSVDAMAGLFTVEIESGAVRKLGSSAGLFFDPVYAVDGRSVFYGMMTKRGIGLFQMPVSKDGAAAGTPVQLKSGEMRVRNLSISRDGTKLLYSGVTAVSGLWSISSADGKRFGDPVLLRQRIGDRITLPKFSPDGKRLLAAAWRTGVCCEVWMMNQDGKNATILSSEANHPNWAPDGKNIFYLAKFTEGSGIGLNRLNIDTRQFTTVMEVPPNIAYWNLAADGRQVVYQLSTKGVVNLWLLDLATGTTRQLTSAKDYVAFPVWSPDGMRIAAELKRGDDDQAITVSAKDGHVRQVTNDAGQHWTGSWTKDGKELILAVQHNGIWNVYSVDIGTGVETPLTHYTSQNAYVRYPQVSPTKKQIVYEYTETLGNIWMLSLKQDGR